MPRMFHITIKENQNRTHVIGKLTQLNNSRWIWFGLGKRSTIPVETRAEAEKAIYLAFGPVLYEQVMNKL